MTVASTIKDQIGPYNLMSLGARNFAALPGNEGLQMKVNRGEYVEVRLNGRDLYDVRWFRLRRGTGEHVELGSRSDVFAENLAESLYDLTQRGNRGAKAPGRTASRAERRQGRR